MALLLKKIVKGFLYLNNELADPRALDYPLMSSPFPTLFILGCYLYFVNNFGPKFMKDRPPYKFDKILIVFNITQIIICLHVVLQFSRRCFFQFNWLCEPIDYSNDPFALLQVRYSWIYFFLKLLDLLDTVLQILRSDSGSSYVNQAVFFVLRKKVTQITFLHIYHHTGMVAATYYGCKYIAGGYGLFVGFFNCAVHAFMYGYYLISVFNEKYKKSIWWKKYITQLQMAQFLIFVIMFGQLLFRTECSYPKYVAILFLPQNIFMLMMFSDFYRKSYLRKKPSESTIQSSKNMLETSDKDK